MGVKLETMAGLIHVVCIYRSLSKVENRALLNEIAEWQVDDNCELIIVGDFNLPDINLVFGRALAPDGTTNEALLNQPRTQGLSYGKTLANAGHVCLP